MSTATRAWTNAYQCVGVGTWMLGMSGSITNSDSSIIYAFNPYGPSGQQYPQFFGLNSSNGIVSTPIVILNYYLK